MALTDTDYLRQLQSLLPPGPAWPKDDGATLTRLFGALSSELARVDGRAWQLVEEADPRTTGELLADWERSAGLPDICSTSRAMDLGAGTYGGLGLANIELFSRASTATYSDVDGLLKTAAINVPRVDYDPITHVAKGLLLEAAATNLLTYSSQFDNVVWSTNLGGSIVDVDQAIAPDGTMTADLLRDNPGSGNSNWLLYTTGLTAGSTYTFSVWVKAVVGYSGDCGVSYYQGNGTGAGWQTAAVTATSVWQRYSKTFTVGAGATDTRVGFSDIFASRIYMWGAQLELGTSPSSYIPTVSATVTRAADICSIYQPLTTQERRAALVNKLVTLGGQSPAYYVGLAAALGYAITITEFHAHSVNDDVNHPFYDAAWNFAWQVNAALNSISQLTVNGAVSDALASWGDSVLECVINRLKPAHTTALFSYT